jgi:hypothetical protein
MSKIEQKQMELSERDSEHYLPVLHTNAVLMLSRGLISQLALFVHFSNFYEYNLKCSSMAIYRHKVRRKNGDVIAAGDRFSQIQGVRARGIQKHMLMF